MAHGAFDLNGKVALVTGALGLLGRKHAKALNDAGARVVCADMDEVSAVKLAEELGEGAMGIGFDVTEKASVEVARGRVMERFGHVDVLVNNAAVNEHFEDSEQGRKQSMFEHLPLEQWEVSLRVNVTGVFLCSQVFGSPMAEQGTGSIINVASTYGLVAPDQSLYVRPDGSRAFFKSPAYPTTKGAVISFTRFLAAYWGHRGVRVNTLSPGGVEAGQEPFFLDNYGKRTPLGRMAKADEYGGAVVFLASDASAYMTGANLVVDGGFTAW